MATSLYESPAAKSVMKDKSSVRVVTAVTSRGATVQLHLRCA